MVLTIELLFCVHENRNKTVSTNKCYANNALFDSAIFHHGKKIHTTSIEVFSYLFVCLMKIIRKVQ